MCIPQIILATMIHAFVTSHLDFCNSFFYNLRGSMIDRIQVVQNSGGQFLTRTQHPNSLETPLAPNKIQN